MPLPTTSLLRPPNIQISTCHLRSLKPFSVPTSNPVSFPMLGVLRKPSGWSPYTTRVCAIRDRDGQEALLCFRAPFMAEDLNATLNRLSRWIISAVFIAIALYRHDVVAVWFAGGSVLNNYVSKILKQKLNQERPSANSRSDPGMPSSHAQSFFFVSTFAVISFLELQGINGYTILASGLTLAFALYFTWLRVLQQMHTISQVVAGAVLGTILCVSWYWLWHGMAVQGFESLSWVRVLVILGPAAAGLTFVVNACRWFVDE